MSEIKSFDVNVLGSFQKQASHGRFAGIAYFDDEQLRLLKSQSKPKE
jgi:hypothetical protein